MAQNTNCIQHGAIVICLLLLTSALAQSLDVHAVPTGKTELVQGPAVWMTEDRFTRMLMAEQVLPKCEVALRASTEEGITASERAVKSFELARLQFGQDEESLETAQRLIWTQGEQLRVAQERNSRLREQRNVALAISTGFLAASATAIVLSLN